MEYIGIFLKCIWNIMNENRKDRSFTEICRHLLHMFLISWIIINISQQCMRTITIYNENVQDYITSSKKYDIECLNYNGSLESTIKTCEQLNITLQTPVVTRTIIMSIKELKTCVFMDCSDLVNIVISHWQYKILFIILCLATLSYSYKFYRFTKKKTLDVIDQLKFKKLVNDHQRTFNEKESIINLI